MTSSFSRSLIDFYLDFIQSRSLISEKVQIKLNMNINYQYELPVPDLVEIRRIVLQIKVTDRQTKHESHYEFILCIFHEERIQGTAECLV